VDDLQDGAERTRRRAAAVTEAERQLGEAGPESAARAREDVSRRIAKGSVPELTRQQRGTGSQRIRPVLGVREVFESLGRERLADEGRETAFG
jgi:hypothetical protein